MLARQLAEPFPAVPADSDALEAARLLAARKLPGLILTDAAGRPVGVLPGSQVLRFVVPGYVQDDPALARAYDEAAADRLGASRAGRPVGALVHREARRELPVVDGDATLIEMAAVMARVHSPVVAVLEHGEFLGAVTVSRLLDVLLPSA